MPNDPVTVTGAAGCAGPPFACMVLYWAVHDLEHGFVQSLMPMGTRNSYEKQGASHAHAAGTYTESL
jgi:hypothetical protein